MIARDGFRWTNEAWGRALRSLPLLQHADHFFTTRQLWLRGASEDADWASVAAAIGVAPERLLRLHQLHGRHAVVVRRDDSAARDRLVAAAQSRDWKRGRPEADIAVSDDPSVALAVQVADCVPLLLADRRSGAVAAVHAGWRGTAAGAGPAAVDLLREQFGTRPEDLVAAHGPSIGACCYEVGDDLVAAFQSAGYGEAAGRWFQPDGQGKWKLDLWRANREQLLAAGLREEDVHQCGLCTATHPDLFPSYRRDGAGTGRIAAVIRSSGRNRE